MHPNDMTLLRPGIGAAVLDVIARFEGDTCPDDADLLGQLHAAITAGDTHAARLFARYCGRSTVPPICTRGH